METIHADMPNWVLGAILMNNNVSKEIVSDLAINHDNEIIRKYALQHKKCPVEVQVAGALSEEKWEHI